MKKFTLNKRLFFILFLPLGIILTQMSRIFPNFVENFYSSFFYKIVANILSSITGFLPFSLAELLILLFAIFIIFYFFKIALDLYRFKNKRIQILKNTFLNILAISGVMYFLFQLLWGFNYQRFTVDKVFQLDIHKSSSKELGSLCEILVSNSNTLRKKIKENQHGVMELPYNKKYLLKIAHVGYDIASEKYTKLKGNYGPPKGILLSIPMCYTGITGFYFPFTNEANINMAEPVSFLPFTIAHEMAHQIGFAKEDEANYISYIACVNNPDINFQYSGTLSALSYSLNALQKSDRKKYKELISTCSNGVLSDFNYNQDFWTRYSGPVEKINDKINDTYLKSQNQQSGTKSYGAMVDLLLAEYRKK